MKKIVIQIIDKAINGNITLDCFNETWPKEAVGNHYYDLIYENLESSIEHFPVKLLSKKPNFEAWRSTDEYFILNIDKAVLSLEIDNSEYLMELREKVYYERPSIDCISKELTNLMGI